MAERQEWLNALFQFTPLREGRLSSGVLMPAMLQFQFTPLREGRHADGKQEAQATYFNSRPSARGDIERTA